MSDPLQFLRQHLDVSPWPCHPVSPGLVVQVPTLDRTTTLNAFRRRNGSGTMDRGLLRTSAVGGIVRTMLNMSTGQVGKGCFLAELIFSCHQHELYTNGSAHMCDCSFAQAAEFAALYW